MELLPEGGDVGAAFKNPVRRGKSFHFLEITNLSYFMILSPTSLKFNELVPNFVEIQRTCPQVR